MVGEQGARSFIAYLDVGGIVVVPDAIALTGKDVFGMDASVGS